MKSLKLMGLSTLWKAINLQWSLHSLCFEGLKGSAMASPTNKAKWGTIPKSWVPSKKKGAPKGKREKNWIWATTWYLLREENSHWLRSYKPQSHRTPGMAAHPPGHSSGHQASGKQNLGEIWLHAIPALTRPGRLIHPHHPNIWVPAPASLLNSEHSVNKK